MLIRSWAMWRASARALLLASLALFYLAQTSQALEAIRLKGGINSYFLASSATGKRPAVVLLHGCTGLGPKGQIGPLYTAWTRALNKAGYHALLVDSAGSRNRAVTCGPSPARKRMYRDRPKDTAAAYAALRGRADVDPQRLFLMGWSQGGGVALNVMNANGTGHKLRFRAAVMLYPGGCDAAHQVAPYRATAPLLILQGTADDWTPAPPCERFVQGLRAQGQDVALTLYQGAYHSFDAPNLPVQTLGYITTDSGIHPKIGTAPKARQAAMRTALAFLARHAR